MMAAVFFMQPVGQLLSQLVGLWVLLGYDHMYDLQHCATRADCTKRVDSIWRWVTGAGAIPAVIAIYYRFRIKDPGLYDLDVKDRGGRALENTEKLYSGTSTNASTEIALQPVAVLNGANAPSDEANAPTNEANVPVNRARPPASGAGQPADEVRPPADDNLPVQFSKEDIYNYFWMQGNWRYLAGTSLCWFLLDLWVSS
jgi:PHS family inorganic phosphate transporter-like MFS transporter